MFFYKSGPQLSPSGGAEQNKGKQSGRRLSRRIFERSSQWNTTGGATNRVLGSVRARGPDLGEISPNAATEVMMTSKLFGSIWKMLLASSFSNSKKDSRNFRAK